MGKAILTKEEAALLADIIYTKFTPFAWRCSCAGSHPDCAGVKADETEQILHYQLKRIRKFVEGLGNVD